MEIIKPRETDFPRLVEIWEKSVTATHDFISREYIKKIKSLLPEFFEIVDLYAATISKHGIIGFSGIADGKIEMLFVDPLWFGQGMGKLLVEHAIKRVNATQVDVNEQNSGAYKFYRKMGFRIVSRSETDSMGKPYPILHLSYQPSGTLNTANS